MGGPYRTDNGEAWKAREEELLTEIEKLEARERKRKIPSLYKRFTALFSIVPVTLAWCAVPITVPLGMPWVVGLATVIALGVLAAAAGEAIRRHG